MCEFCAESAIFDNVHLKFLLLMIIKSTSYWAWRMICKKFHGFRNFLIIIWLLDRPTALFTSPTIPLERRIQVLLPSWKSLKLVMNCFLHGHWILQSRINRADCSGRLQHGEIAWLIGWLHSTSSSIDRYAGGAVIRSALRRVEKTLLDASEWGRQRKDSDQR